MLDACVLFPTVLREMLLGAAGVGAFRPVWSVRILEEWARATRRLPLGAEAIARAEIALMREAWPGAEVSVPDGLVESLSLPDKDDRHVLATAIAAGAGSLVTRNRSDFPPRLLAPIQRALARPRRVPAGLSPRRNGSQPRGRGGAGPRRGGFRKAAADPGASETRRAATSRKGAGSRPRRLIPPTRTSRADRPRSDCRDHCGVR